MKICPVCRREVAEDSRFCPVCGAQVPVTAPAQPTPVAADAVEQPPVQYAQPPHVAPAPPPVQPPIAYAQPMVAPPVTPAPSKGKAIAGMALGIGGMVMGILGVFFSLLMTALPQMAQEVEAMGIMGFVYALIFLVYALPLSIVGLVLCNGCIAQGSTLPMCRRGRAFAIAGLVLCGVMVLIAIISLASFTQVVTDPYSYYEYYY